jgi:hypothetical protein
MLANHTQIERNDTIRWRFHIAILEDKWHDENDQMVRIAGMAYTRRTMIKEANTQLAKPNTCGG